MAVLIPPEPDDCGVAHMNPHHLLQPVCPEDREDENIVRRCKAMGLPRNTNRVAGQHRRDAQREESEDSKGKPAAPRAPEA